MRRCGSSVWLIYFWDIQSCTISRVYGCKNFAGKYMVGLHYQPPCQCRMEAQPVRMEAQPVKEALMKQWSMAWNPWYSADFQCLQQVQWQARKMYGWTILLHPNAAYIILYRIWYTKKLLRSTGQGGRNHHSHRPHCHWNHSRYKCSVYPYITWK